MLSLKIGAYTEVPEPFMGPVISAAAAKGLLHSQQELINKGGIPLIEMALLNPESAFLTPGLIDATPISRQEDREIFGPLLQLIYVSSFDEAIEEANHTAYGLSAALLSDNESLYRKFLHSIRAGVVNWNTATTGASSTAPFGGIGQSGNHRPSAYYAADYCSYPMASIESKTLILPEKTLPGIGI
jgi:succinylglutamic semialdehyde dehydrogenase